MFAKARRTENRFGKHEGAGKVTLPALCVAASTLAAASPAASETAKHNATHQPNIHAMSVSLYSQQQAALRELPSDCPNASIEFAGSNGNIERGARTVSGPTGSFMDRDIAHLTQEHSSRGRTDTTGVLRFAQSMLRSFASNKYEARGDSSVDNGGGDKSDGLSNEAKGGTFKRTRLASLTNSLENNVKPSKITDELKIELGRMGLDMAKKQYFSPSELQKEMRKRCNSMYDCEIQDLPEDVRTLFISAIFAALYRKDGPEHEGDLKVVQNTDVRWSREQILEDLSTKRPVKCSKLVRVVLDSFEWAKLDCHIVRLKWGHPGGTLSEFGHEIVQVKLGAENYNVNIRVNSLTESTLNKWVDPQAIQIERSTKSPAEREYWRIQDLKQFFYNGRVHQGAYPVPEYAPKGSEEERTLLEEDAKFSLIDQNLTPPIPLKMWQDAQSWQREVRPRELALLAQMVKEGTPEGVTVAEADFKKSVLGVEGPFMNGENKTTVRVKTNGDYNVVVRVYDTGRASAASLKNPGMATVKDLPYVTLTPQSGSDGLTDYVLDHLTSDSPNSGKATFFVPGRRYVMTVQGDFKTSADMSYPLLYSAIVEPYQGKTN